MDDLLQAIRRSLADANYFPALFLTVILPSVCAALESEDNQDSRDRYIAWYDRYCGGLFLTGADCYYLRCALLHQATTQHRNAGFSRVLFTFLTQTGNVYHNNVLNDALNLDIPTFCNHILAGAERWRQAVQGTQPYTRNLERTIRTHPNGLPPYLVGVPLIS